jgi:hypothetical protein
LEFFQIRRGSAGFNPLGARAISFRGYPVFTLIITSLAPAFARGRR